MISLMPVRFELDLKQISQKHAHRIRISDKISGLKVIDELRHFSPGIGVHNSLLVVNNF